MTKLVLFMAFLVITPLSLAEPDYYGDPYAKGENESDNSFSGTSQDNPSGNINNSDRSDSNKDQQPSRPISKSEAAGCSYYGPDAWSYKCGRVDK
jgi:hypothetical protein